MAKSDDLPSLEELSLEPSNTPASVRQPTTEPDDGLPSLEEIGAAQEPKTWYDKVVAALDKAQDLGARAAHIPGGGKTVKRVGHGLNQLTNAITTGGLDLAKFLGSGGREHLPPEDFQGELKPASEIMEKRFGWSPWVAQPAGLVTSALADPVNAGIGALGEAGAAVKPIGNAMQGAAKRIYRSPFAKVDAEVATKFRNGAKNPHAFTDVLWNEGEPLVGGFKKSNPEIGQEITELRKDSYKPIQAAIEKAGEEGPIDLAPDLKAKIQGQQILEAGDKFEGLDKLPDPHEWLKKKLAGKASDREQALGILQEAAPELSPVIEMTGKHLKNSGDKEEALRFFHGLIDDLSEGARSPEELQAMKVAMSNKAARNQQMGSNQYARNALPNVHKTAEMHGAQAVGKVLDDVIDNAVGKTGAIAADKARYSTLRRGELPAWQTVKQAAGRHGVSKLDYLAGLLGAGGAYEHDPKLLIAGALTKAAHETQRSPRIGTGVGKALNRAGKLNIWDDMLRRGLTQKLYGQEPDGQGP